MTEEDKKRLIDAVNSWAPHNNITEIYYKIGRAVPFTTQRFPDGRDSRWYRSQYVQVVEVKPRGEYGNAYGFYYRNGERANSSDVESFCWCRKDDKEPQKIPNSGCGGWRLLDIQGEPTKEIRLRKPDDVIEFGEYKGHTLREVANKDYKYLIGLVFKTRKFFFDMNEVSGRGYKSSDIMPFGEYKGQTLASIYANDPNYIRQLEKSNKYFKVDWNSIFTQGKPPVQKPFCFKSKEEIDGELYPWDW